MSARIATALGVISLGACGLFIGGGGGQLHAPERVSVGEEVPIRVCVFHPRDKEITGRYTDFSLEYRLTGGDKAGRVPGVRCGASAGDPINSESYCFVVPASETSRKGTLEYTIHSMFDGHSNTVQGTVLIE